MTINILGPCTPGPSGNCTDPLDPDALASIVDSLPITGKEGNVDFIIPGQLGISWPPGLSRAITGFVAQPENKLYGLFHLPELHMIWINSTTLHKVLDSGLFRSGNYYYQLVYAIRAIGLQAVDIEYLPPQGDAQ
jgi:hypothetical protein